MKKTTLLILFLVTITTIFSQEKESNLYIYLNCNFCDQSYIKQNLEHAEFVRDEKFADVYLFFTNERNGSGGRVYEIEFVGQNDYKDFKDLITFSTNSNNTREEVRALMLKNIQLGLVRYWLKAGLQDKITITLKKTKPSDLIEEVDPWNNWIFDFGANGYFNGQETYSSRNINFNVSSRRITENNKFIFRLRYGNDKSVYEIEGKPDVVYNNSNKNATLYNVFSINNHWSVGVFGYFGGSDYSNKNLYVNVSPAIEYNFFDYKESFKKQLTLAYRIGGDYTEYIEKTVFDKTEEFLWNHSLGLNGSVRQTWGDINGSVRYESYLHDTSLNQFSFNLGA